MAAERHVGTPECLNETCTCGMPKSEEWGPAAKERRERIATAVLAAFVTHNSVSPQINWQLTAQCALSAADALIAEMDKGEK